MAVQVKTLRLNDLYSTLVNSLLSLSHLTAFLKGLNSLKRSCLRPRIGEQQPELDRKKILPRVGAKIPRMLGSLASKPQIYARFARSLTLFTVSVEVVYHPCVPSSALRETAFDRKDFL